MTQDGTSRAKTPAYRLGRVLVAAVLGACAATAVAAPDFGNCEVTGQKGSVKLTTLVPGALSVRPVLSSRGWWNGSSLETTRDGFEYCLAANMAYRAGLDGVILVSRSFPQVLTGQATGFDIVLSEVTITDERKKTVNFTDPYYNSTQGLLVKKGTKVDPNNLEKLRIGVQQGTTAYEFVNTHIKPTEQPKVFPDTSTMYAALAAGQIDAAIYDTENVLLRAKGSNGMLEVAGRFDTGEQWGGIVNKDSPNLAAFNKLIAEMKKDGTLEKLSAKYLAPELGMDPSTLPALHAKH